MDNAARLKSGISSNFQTCDDLKAVSYYKETDYTLKYSFDSSVPVVAAHFNTVASKVL